MDIKQILKNMGILGIFVFSIMAFMVITQTNNDVSIPITNNTLINATYSDLEGNLTSAETRATRASGNFGNTTPTARQFGELEVTSIVSPTRIAKTIIIGFWNIFIKLPQSILGVSQAVASLISSLLLISLIIGIWAIWKGVIKQ